MADEQESKKKKSPLLTRGQKWSFGRHVITFAMGFLAAIMMFHVGVKEVADEADWFAAMVKALEPFGTGLVALGGLASGIAAAWSASPLRQAIALRQAIPNTTIVTSPKIADATPDPGIVANTEPHLLAPVPPAP